MLYTHYLYPVKLSMNQFFYPNRTLPIFHSTLESMNRMLPAMYQPPSHLNICDDISCGCEIETRKVEKRKKIYIKINVLSTKLICCNTIFSAMCLWLVWTFSQQQHLWFVRDKTSLPLTGQMNAIRCCLLSLMTLFYLAVSASAQAFNIVFVLHVGYRFQRVYWQHKQELCTVYACCGPFQS